MKDNEEDISGSFSYQMHNNLPFMGMGAVLEQVNSLPDSQARFIFLHWYGQLGLGERGPDMCRHVVRAFRLVLEKRIAIGNQPVKKPV
jgi:hypothetical protein